MKYQVSTGFAEMGKHIPVAVGSRGVTPWVQKCLGTGGRGSGNQRDAGETPRGGLLGGAPLAVPMVMVSVSHGEAENRVCSPRSGGAVLNPLKLR